MVSCPARDLLGLVVGFALCAAPVGAQTIPIRTVPVASGDQFLFFPSETLAMGGLSVAMDDSLAAGWTNPAKGRLVSRTTFMGAPSFYSVTNDGGSGRTFPVGGVFTGDEFFGGVVLAAQQIESTHSDGVFFYGQPTVIVGAIPRFGVSDTFARNLYASVYFGTLLGDGTWSFGLGVAGATLEAMDGVERLYAAADRIQQAGSTQDARIGFHRNGARDRVSLLFLVNRVAMTHDVSFTDLTWDDSAMVWIAQSRFEHNEEKTQTLGLQVAWDRDIFDSGWSVGASATVNRNDHPQFPNYEIQNIPLDPGSSSAYEMALGVSKSSEAMKVGVEVVLRPIWSETWQVAGQQLQDDTDGEFLIGDRTFERNYAFMNLVTRVGVSRRLGPTALQLGLEARSNAYTVEQIDHVAGTSTQMDETWVEWTPSFGAIVHLSAFDVRYAGRLKTGDIGWYGIEPLDPAGPQDPGSAGTQIPPTLQLAKVVTHQFAVMLPVG